MAERSVSSLDPPSTSFHALQVFEAHLIDLQASGQLAMRQVFEAHLKRVDRWFTFELSTLRPRPLEHLQAVILQEALLIAIEVANAGTRVDSPFLEQVGLDVRDHQQLLTVREADVALVEQVIDVWR